MPIPSAKPKFYLTTPIYYTNGLPHIGHTYSTIVCDTIRRYKRMCGFDVVMTTGTDEHGVNVERSAKAAGMKEADYVNKLAAEWRKIWDEFRNSGRRIYSHYGSAARAHGAMAFQIVPRKWIRL